MSAGPGASFRRYSHGGVTAARIGAAVLVTMLCLPASVFAYAANPGPAGLAIAIPIGLLSLATWIVVLRQPKCITLGEGVTIAFPVGTRRYRRDELIDITRVEKPAGFMFLGMHTSRPAFLQFRMSDGRRYTVPIDEREGVPG
jgi:hypothetical protein